MSSGMLRIKGQTESGEWVEFNISQVYDVCLYKLDDNRWCIKGYPNDYVIDTATIQLAEDPRKALSEHEVLTRVQAMGEESLSPDNFESLMRALGALKTTRNVDADSEDPGAELAVLREQVKLLRGACQSGIDALGGIMNHYGTGLQVSNWHLNGDTEPWDNFFDDDRCGESLETLSAALEQTKPKDGE